MKRSFVYRNGGTLGDSRFQFTIRINGRKRSDMQKVDMIRRRRDSKEPPRSTMNISDYHTSSNSDRNGMEKTRAR